MHCESGGADAAVVDEDFRSGKKFGERGILAGNDSVVQLLNGIV